MRLKTNSNDDNRNSNDLNYDGSSNFYYGNTNGNNTNMNGYNNNFSSNNNYGNNENMNGYNNSFSNNNNYGNNENINNLDSSMRTGYRNNASNFMYDDNVYYDRYQTNEQPVMPVSKQLLENEKARVVLCYSFLYMFIALFISFGTAFATYIVGFGSGFINVSNFKAIFYSVIGLEFVMVLICNIGLKNKSLFLSLVGFILYSICNGITFSTIFVCYNLSSIICVFGISSVCFALFALFGFVTKIDLSPLAAFFSISVLGIIIGTIVGMFFFGEGFNLFICIFGIVIFAGITAFDMQKIKNYAFNSGDSPAWQIGIYGGLDLYLDFINIFIRLIRLFGKRK